MKRILFYDRSIEEREEMMMNPVIVRNVSIGEGMPKICVPIVGKTRDEILETAKEILNSPADLVEWRADWFESVFDIEEVKGVLADLRTILGELPMLFTFRTKAEGGEEEITYKQYSKLLKKVADTGLTDLIDVEVFIDDSVAELVAQLKEAGVKIVGSNHDFAKTPDKDEVVRRLCYMQNLGVDIPKIAVMPQNKRDVLTLLTATEEMASEYANCPIVTMSMSGMGAISRVSGETFGSAITFGALKKASAPGQIQVEDLKKMLEIMHIEP